MKTCFSFVFFLLIVLNTTIAQNLVLNPSFEQHKNCVLLQNAFDSSNVTDWNNLYPYNTGNVQYFNSCELFSLTNGNSVPKNNLGYQYAKNGDAYVCIEVGGGIDTTKTYIAACTCFCVGC
jgi:OmpA-OmpF porin, OOP family